MDSTNNSTLLRDLVARWQAGDMAAREELLRRAKSRLEMMARAELKDFPDVRKEGTDFLLARSMDRLHRALGENVPKSLKHFFVMASKHIRWELLDMKRALRGRHDQKPRILSLSDNDPPETPGGPLAKKNDLRTEIHEAYESLPDVEKEVIDLLFYQDCTQEEAAEAIGKSVRTVQTRYAAAKLRLRMMLGEDEGRKLNEE